MIFYSKVYILWFYELGESLQLFDPLVGRGRERETPFHVQNCSDWQAFVYVGWKHLLLEALWMALTDSQLTLECRIVSSLRQWRENQIIKMVSLPPTLEFDLLCLPMFSFIFSDAFWIQLLPIIISCFHLMTCLFDQPGYSGQAHSEVVCMPVKRIQKFKLLF